MMAAAVLHHERPSSERIGHQVAMAARRHGVVVRPLGDSIILMPPLAMSTKQIDSLGQAVGAAIADVLGD
jgi:adenosylmethionine-8-amino-7-oxononanoate aminotransferase